MPAAPVQRAWVYGQIRRSANVVGAHLKSARVHRSNRLDRIPCGSVGSDITQSFLDLASLVASDTSSNKSAFDDLAYTIGNDAYADLNGWHLYLKDMSTVPGGPKMHQLLAEQLGTAVLSDRFNEKDVLEFLAKVPVKLGQGKANVSLDAVLPKMCVQDILRAVEDFERDN